MISPRSALEKAKLSVVLKSKQFGRSARFFTSVSSTNDVAREMARQGAEHGFLVVASEQTAGRGRAGRPWYSAPGAGLWFSLVLRPRMQAQRCGLLSLAAALAVAEAVEKTTGVSAELKWPNDVLIGGKKLCGILAESELVGDRLRFAVLGIGLNTNRAQASLMPSAIPEAATWLSDHVHELPEDMTLLASILMSLERRCEDLEAGRLKAIIRAWRKRCVHLGKAVRIVGAPAPLEGVAEDIAEDGSLLVRTPSGELRPVVAGDCHLLRA